MSFKKFILTGCAVAILGSSVSAMAAGVTLTIDNQTSYNSASYVNGWLCSSSIPRLPNGVTPHHSKNTLTYYQLRGACVMNQSDCTADIYGNDACADTSATTPIGKIGTAVIDTSTGLKSVNITDPRFEAKWDKTSVSITCAASNPELCKDADHPIK